MTLTCGESIDMNDAVVQRATQIYRLYHHSYGYNLMGAL